MSIDFSVDMFSQFNSFNGIRDYNVYCWIYYSTYYSTYWSTSEANVFIAELAKVLCVYAYAYKVLFGVTDF